MSQDSDYNNWESEEAIDKLYPPDFHFARTQPKSPQTYSKGFPKNCCILGCLIILLIACVGVCCYGPFFYFIYPEYSRATAMALVPPEYPNSMLVDEYSGGGSQGIINTRVYETQDSTEAVIEFMEEYTPDFEYDPQLQEYYSHISPPKGIYYGDGWVSVTVSQKEDDSSVTVIKYRIYWVSPSP